MGLWGVGPTYIAANDRTALANVALVVAQHEGRLDDVPQRGHLLVAKQVLEQRKETRSHEAELSQTNLRPLRTRSKTKAEA